jgi:DNA-3-methyladenine glycosylase
MMPSPVVHPALDAGTTPLSLAFYARPAPEVARALIGMQLLVSGVGGRVVETEAYAHDDPASHSFNGRTARNAAMFGSPGRAYVYRSYGLHWCLNVVCNVAPGSAVLIRALEPEHGLDLMHERRGQMPDRDLCRGPGRLCQALAVTGALDGQLLDTVPFTVLNRTAQVEVVTGRRIGITRGADTLWRFGLAGSRFLSRPMPS